MIYILIFDRTKLFRNIKLDTRIHLILVSYRYDNGQDKNIKKSDELVMFLRKDN